MIGIRQRSGTALMCGVVMLLLATTAGCSSGGPKPPPRPTTSASQPPATATDAPSAAAPTGLLYSGKSATFSATWAVEHGCPINVNIDFTDSGARLRDPNTSGSDPNGHAWPGLKWSPPCSGITPQIDFDGQAVAKVSGSLTQASCQAAAEQSLRNGTALQGYSVPSLAAGDEFCEYDRTRGRVILMQVASVSSNTPVQITWSVTEWAVAVPTATATAPDGAEYADQTFALSAKQPGRSDCTPSAVTLYGSDGPLVKFSEGGDMVYFPACLGGSGEAKIRFESPAAPVNGDVGASACEDAAAASGQNTLEVALSALHPGSEYCEFLSMTHAVVRVKVVSIGTDASASLQFSATEWKAPVS